MHEARKTALPTATLRYLVFSLAGEVGELINVVKKVMRGDKTLAESQPLIEEELGGIMWYVIMIFNQYPESARVNRILDSQLEAKGGIETNSHGSGLVERIAWLSQMTHGMMMDIFIFDKETIGINDLEWVIIMIRDICRITGIDLHYVCQRNADLLAVRAAKGTLQGHNRQDEH